MEPNAIPGFHASQAGAICGARAGEFPRDREVVSARPSPKSPDCRCAKNSSRSRQSRAAPVLTVLITGGSQGSRTLNRAAQESWPLWDRARRAADSSDRVAHAYGTRAEIPIDPESTARSRRFSPICRRRLLRADIVVSRAGMGTVSELAAAGKPSILVPLPTAADQHQLRNAEALERDRRGAHGAGCGVERRSVWWRKLRACRRVRICSKRWAKLRESFAKPGAARRAADVLESVQ